LLEDLGLEGQGGHGQANHAGSRAEERARPDEAERGEDYGKDDEDGLGPNTDFHGFLRALYWATVYVSEGAATTKNIIQYYGSFDASDPLRAKEKELRAAFDAELARNALIVEEKGSPIRGVWRVPFILISLSLLFAALSIGLSLRTYYVGMETLFYQPSSLFTTEALLIDALRKRANLEISKRDELIAEYKRRVALRDELLKNLVPEAKPIQEALPQQSVASTEPPVAALQKLDQGAAIDALYAQRLSQTLDTAAQYLADVDVRGAEKALADFRTSLGPKDRLDSPFARASYAIADNLSNAIARMSTMVQDSAAQKPDIQADPATLAALQAARADLETARAALGAKDVELAAAQARGAAAKSEADMARAALEASRSQAAIAQAQAAIAQAQADKARAELGQSQVSLLQEGAANEALRERVSALERIAATPPPPPVAAPNMAPAVAPAAAPSALPTAAPGIRGAFLGTVAIAAGNRLVIDLVEGARTMKGGQVEVYARGASGEEAPLARGIVTALRANSAEITLENPGPASQEPTLHIQDAVYAIQ